MGDHGMSLDIFCPIVTAVLRPRRQLSLMIGAVEPRCRGRLFGLVVGFAAWVKMVVDDRQIATNWTL